MIEHKYWIIFDGVNHPEIITAKTWMEFSDKLNKLVENMQKYPEHIIRKY